VGAPSKRAKKIRTVSEFDLQRLVQRLHSMRVSSAAYSWNLSEIAAARDAQMRGVFKLPARLAESFRTDDAMYTAHRTRLAPQLTVPVKIEPPNQSPAALRVANEADALYGPEGVGITLGTCVTINSNLANHGVAFAVCTATPRLGGARVDLQCNAWPIEWVRWDPIARRYMTQVDSASMTELATEWVNGAYQLTGAAQAAFRSGTEVPIVHGDGRWVVFEGSEVEPWKDCCVLPGALTWARHAFGLRDMSKGSAAHGNAKVVGELPDNVTIESAEGLAFLDLLIAIASGDMPVGIRPAGSKVDYLTNNSQAWQIFKELVTAAKVSASQIYLGHDGTLGTNGSGPGIDLKTLLAVSQDRIEGDLRVMERQFLTGVIEPWAAMNFGDSRLAPKRRYQIQDIDQDTRRAAEHTRRAAFLDTIERERELGFDVTTARIESLALEYGTSAADLAPEGAKAPSIALAPTDLAKVVMVNEARASAQLGPLLLPDGSPDPDGRLTVEEFAAKKAAKAEAQATPALPAATSPKPRAA